MLGGQSEDLCNSGDEKQWGPEPRRAALWWESQQNDVWEVRQKELSFGHETWIKERIWHPSF